MTAPRNSMLGSFALLCGALLCAVVGGAVALVFGRADATPVPEQHATGGSELERFAVRLDLLEETLSRTPARAATAKPVAPDQLEPQRHEAIVADGAAMAEIGGRLAALERAVAELQATAGSRQSAADGTRAARRDDPAEELRRIESWQTAILDPTTSEQQKLEAWGELRHRENAWNDAVVAQMVHVGLNSADAATRADVWRQADARSQHESLVPALLQSLQLDADAKVREEAAETLVEYRDRPTVVAMIDSLLAIEQDQGVLGYLRQVKDGGDRRR
ncbi:MAG: hypothetical protein KDE27_01555 [Planctomycetes bacterium]|nr:hypothetical protein [Planctomycetota bacterium]